MKNTVYIVAAIVIIALGVFFFTGERAGDVSNDVAPAADTNGEMMMPDDAEETTLRAVEGREGQGVAVRYVDEDRGVFVHRVAVELPDPPSDKFYEGWLVDPDPALRFFSTGALEREGGQYVLTYESDLATRNFLEFNTVVITEETLALGLDGIPEDHVLDGSF